MSTEHLVGPGIKEFITGANFLVVASIVYMLGKKGISAALKDRSSEVERQLSDAQAQLTLARSQLEQVKIELADINGVRTKHLAEAEKQAKEVAGAILLDAQQTAERILKDAKLTIEQEFRTASYKLREALVKEAFREAQTQLAAGKASEVHDKLVIDFGKGL